MVKEKVVNNDAVQEVDVLVNKALTALDEFRKIDDQERIDAIVQAAAVAAVEEHGPLAIAAVEETGRGNIEDKAIKNLSDLLIKLDDETIKKILNNKMLISEISYLLPFINLIDELNTNTFTNILANYDRIKDKISIGNTDNETEDYKTTLLKNFILIFKIKLFISIITILNFAHNIV